MRVLKRKGLFQKEGAIWCDSVHTILASRTTSFLVTGLSRAYKIDELQKVGEAEDNMKERVATFFDAEQHLEKARNARGKKKGVVVEPNKTQLRKARKQTDGLVIGDTGTKVYEKSKVVKNNVRKQYSKKDYSMFKPGAFVSIRNASVKKGQGQPTNPFYFLARIKAAGKEFEVTWFKRKERRICIEVKREVFGSNTRLVSIFNIIFFWMSSG